MGCFSSIWWCHAGIYGYGWAIQAISSVEKMLQTLEVFGATHLWLNSDKTHFSWLGSRGQFSKIDFYNLRHCFHDVSPVCAWSECHLWPGIDFLIWRMYVKRALQSLPHSHNGTYAVHLQLKPPIPYCTFSLGWLGQFHFCRPNFYCINKLQPISKYSRYSDWPISCGETATVSMKAHVELRSWSLRAIAVPILS